MISTKKSYVAYTLQRRKNIYIPPLEEQLREVFRRYTARFGSEPETHYIGPILNEQGQTLIKDGEVWIEIPKRTRTFTTAYPQEE